MLFEALWSDVSPEAQRFALDYDTLRHRWHRLIKAIFAYRNGFFPLAALEDTEHDLEILETDFKSRYYPKPRPLTVEEQSCLEWRTAIANCASQEIYENLGRPLNLPPNWDGTEEPWKTWEDTCTFLAKWGNEPFTNANPGLRLRKWRRRKIIVTYREEISAFCDRWRLNAWWAVPAIIQHHFFQADYEPIVDSAIPPLSVYTSEPVRPIALPITVKLPGISEEKFEADKERALNLAETTVIQGAGGPIRVIRTRFSREDRDYWENSVGSTCVLLEWDGHRFLHRRVEPPASGDPESPVSMTPSSYLVERCQDRVGRPLTYREKRGIRSQVASQIASYRSVLGEAGWVVLGSSELDVIAAVVARRLLSPSTSWSDLSSMEVVINSERYWEFQNLRRACQNFADSAKFKLPKGFSGNARGSHSIEH